MSYAAKAKKTYTLRGLHKFTQEVVKSLENMSKFVRRQIEEEESDASLEEFETIFESYSEDQSANFTEMTQSTAKTPMEQSARDTLSKQLHSSYEELRAAQKLFADWQEGKPILLPAVYNSCVRCLRALQTFESQLRIMRKQAGKLLAQRGADAEPPRKKAKRTTDVL